MNNPYGNNDAIDQDIADFYDEEYDLFDQGNNLFNQQPRRNVTFQGVTRNLSNRNDNSVMTLDQQEEFRNLRDRETRSRGLNPRNVYRRNEQGQNATNHGYSGSVYREVDYDRYGNIVNNDPYGQWTSSGYKRYAQQDLQKSINFVRTAKPLYERYIHYLNNGIVSLDSPMEINGQQKTVRDFINMYEEHKEGIPEKQMPGGKSKKNRKTKRKKKQRRKSKKHRKKLKK